MIRHVPNLLSALRLLAAPFAAWLIVAGHDTAALCVFALAGASDGLDGWVARRFGFTSSFGAWLDPAADKLLMLLCFTALTMIHASPVWLLGLVVARDACIVMGWAIIRLAHLSLPQQPLMLGKASTAAQILYILLLLVLLALGLEWPRLTGVAAGLTGIFTLLSGGAYAGLFLHGIVRRKI